MIVRLLYLSEKLDERYYPEKPQGGADRWLRFMAILLFPKLNLAIAATSETKTLRRKR
ncbi:MAG: hypothetical protein ACXW0L_09650 [Methylosarcina sp.]